MRTRGFIAVLAVGIVAVTSIAGGSPPEEWERHEKEVTSACLAASNLRDARTASSLISFDDLVGISALIIDGRYPQPHMKNAPARMLCLFDRRSRIAHLSAADSIAPAGAGP